MVRCGVVNLWHGVDLFCCWGRWAVAARWTVGGIMQPARRGRCGRPRMGRGGAGRSRRGGVSVWQAVALQRRRSGCVDGGLGGGRSGKRRAGSGNWPRDLSSHLCAPNAPATRARKPPGRPAPAMDAKVAKGAKNAIDAQSATKDAKNTEDERAKVGHDTKSAKA